MNICAELRAGRVTSCAEDTQALAEALAQALPPDSILALHGDLGVGKTTFIRGLARGFGIHQTITSPTFTLFNLYTSPAGVNLVHMDAYRLEGGHQMESLMLEDFLRSPFCLAVEWPERLGDWLPPQTLHLTLAILEGQKHHVQLA